MLEVHRVGRMKLGDVGGMVGVQNKHSKSETTNLVIPLPCVIASVPWAVHNKHA